jgi:hypothetical protein
MNSAGSLNLVNTVPTGLDPILAIVDATGQFAYVAGSGLGDSPQPTISEYTIASDGTLTLIVTFDEELSPTFMTLSPNGFIYLSQATPTEDGGFPGAIIEFSVNEANGGLANQARWCSRPAGTTPMSRTKVPGRSRNLLSMQAQEPSRKTART